MRLDASRIVQKELQDDFPMLCPPGNIYGNVVQLIHMWRKQES